MTTISPLKINEYVDFINQLADIADAELSSRHEGSQFETKADLSPVTEFDRAVENKLREAILAKYPDHGVVGEEFPPYREDAEFVWIMDPIDGTKPFVSGLPVFTTLIALCHRGKPIIGVIHAAAVGDRWLGVQGRPTMLNGKAIKTSGRTELDGATLAFSQPDMVLDEHRAGLNAINQRVAWCVYGAASYGFGRLAAGAIDIAAYSGSIGAYDICALAPIIEGAGGKITDGLGNEITLETPEACLAAATPALHLEALNVLNQGHS